MRWTALLLAVAAVAVGCGDGDGEPAATAPAETQPVASVPEPGEPMAMRCDTAGLDAPGLESLVADGVDCSEAESVLLNWLQGCGGEEGLCEPVPGYSCFQVKAPGSRSVAQCVKGDATVRLTFE